LSSGYGADGMLFFALVSVPLKTNPVYKANHRRCCVFRADEFAAEQLPTTCIEV